MFRRATFFTFVALFCASAVWAADVPGGLVYDGDGLRSNSYELLLSPAYEIAPGGAYLSSMLRYQANDDFGVGVGFGAGELGFNFGMNGIWYVLPDTPNQPAFAILGGMYVNRVSQANYFVVKAVPMVSKAMKVSWGKVTPYAGLHLVPSFRLGQAENDFSMKTTLGTKFAVKSWNGLELWSEVGIGLLHSPEEIVLGVSYPFNAI
jgi:hypothetical protein